METWDGLAHGPLKIECAEGYLVRVGNEVVGLGRTQFLVLLRLMACHGRVVSLSVLERGVPSLKSVRVAIVHLRKLLKRHFCGQLQIITIHYCGYKLSLTGEFFCAGLLFFHQTCNLFVQNGRTVMSRKKKARKARMEYQFEDYIDKDHPPCYMRWVAHAELPEQVRVHFPAGLPLPMIFSHEGRPLVALEHPQLAQTAATNHGWQLTTVH